MSPGADSSPEARARRTIDSLLQAAGWEVQDRDEINVWAGSPPHGVAVREFAMRERHGFADYLLFVNGKAVGASTDGYFHRSAHDTTRQVAKSEMFQPTLRRIHEQLF